MIFSHNSLETTVYVILAVLLVVLGAAFVGRSAIRVQGTLRRTVTLGPNESFQGEILIHNPGEKPTGFEVIKKDYLFYADGTNKYPPTGTIKRSNASWIEISLPSDTSIQPGDSFPLTYDVHVPSDSSLSGTYWSMIMVQSTPPPSEGPEEGIGVRQVLRYGVQIAVNIGDTGERKIDLLDVKPVRNNGSKLVQVNVKNVGQRAVSPVAKVELYDQGGKKYGPFEGSEYMIYPGCSVSYKVPLKDVPDEKFQGVILIDNGDQYIWGARKGIDFSSNNSNDTEE